MNTLDRYIFRKALFMWLGALVSLVGLVVVAQFFGNISMFSEHAADTVSILLFMALKIPPILSLIIPFSICLGILAAQAQFSRHVETIAMQASGVSDKRIFLPYIVLGLLATLLMGFLAFYASPAAQKQANRIEDIEIRRKGVIGSFSQSGCRFQSGDAIYFAELIDVKAGRLQDITCYRMAAGKLIAVLKAKEAQWDGRRWLAHAMQEIVLSGTRIAVKQGLRYLPLESAPADLITAGPNPDVLTIMELGNYLSRLDVQDLHSRTLETAYYSRISFALAPLIMSLLVLPFGMRFPRTGGIARGVALGLVLGLAYWGLHTGMTTAGASGYVRPLVAAWSANALACITGLALIGRRRGAYG